MDSCERWAIGAMKAEETATSRAMRFYIFYK
jgi:hypothetical protein